MAIDVSTTAHFRGGLLQGSLVPCSLLGVTWRQCIGFGRSSLLEDSPKSPRPEAGVPCGPAGGVAVSARKQGADPRRACAGDHACGLRHHDPGCVGDAVQADGRGRGGASRESKRKGQGEAEEGKARIVGLHSAWVAPDMEGPPSCSACFPHRRCFPCHGDPSHRRSSHAVDRRCSRRRYWVGGEVFLDLHQYHSSLHFAILPRDALDGDYSVRRDGSVADQDQRTHGLHGIQRVIKIFARGLPRCLQVGHGPHGEADEQRAETAACAVHEASPFLVLRHLREG
mmetsp:Transcript_10541/g.19755  ORF Transcript_10541/g.19755 Transcript_10541/m.19755 type:complete len:284 (-) Transcript_10541:1667-2518(-)